MEVGLSAEPRLSSLYVTWHYYLMALVLLSVKLGCKWLEHTLGYLFLLWHLLFLFAVVFPPQIWERRLQFLVRTGRRKPSVVHHLLSHLKSSILFLKTRGWFDESGKWLSVKLDTESNKILRFWSQGVWVIEDTYKWERGIAKFLVLSFRCWQNFQIRLTDMGRREEMVRCMERVTWKLTLS